MIIRGLLRDNARVRSLAALSSASFPAACSNNIFARRMVQNGVLSSLYLQTKVQKFRFITRGESRWKLKADIL